MRQQQWFQTMTLRTASSAASAKLLGIFEQRIGARLPADYRNFLQEVNGGRPIGPEGAGDYAMIDVDWQGRPPQQSDDRAILDVLLAAEDWSGSFAGGTNPALTLDGVYDAYVVSNRCLPPGLVPIGRDPGSSLFVLDVAAENPGEVWFWSADWFERSRLVTDPYHNMASLAPCFSDFLEKIVFEG